MASDRIEIAERVDAAGYEVSNAIATLRLLAESFPQSPARAISSSWQCFAW
jgi:hypothetical protein